MSTVSCSKFSSNSLKVTFTSLSGGGVDNSQTLDFLVNSITNPPSTKPTSDFTNIIAYDSLSNQLSTYSNVVVATTTPATVVTSSIS